MKILVNSKEFEVDVLETKDNKVLFQINGKNILVEVANQNNEIKSAGNLSPRTPEFGNSSKDGYLIAEIPGLVHSIIAKVGDKISSGSTILVLEAMKMQNRILATIDSEIEEILISEGEEVKKGQRLVKLK